jgi:glycosyltransferase involved in cell wall biosynthesis
MRLLVVGHSFITAFAQRKYAVMKELDRSLQMKLLIPKRVRHPFMTYTPEVASGLAQEEVVCLDTLFPFRSNMTYLFRPGQLSAELKGFRPDVVYVEEEPHAFITAETAVLATRAAPTAAICAFTWDNLYRRRPFPLNFIKKRVGALVLRRCDAVVCGNREAEALLRARRAYSGSSFVLPQMGIDPDEYAPGPSELRARLGINGGVCIGYVGRLVPEKGVLLLLQALTLLEHHPWRLLLVGSGPLEEDIRVHWTPRFPDRIVHVPAVPHREVHRYLRCLDIFVLASRSTASWKEQFGLTLAQAMMTQVPAVVSSSGAIPEVVGPGGVIVPEGDVAALAAGLEQLLVSSERREAVGAQARSFAIRNYATEAVAAQYLRVFEAAHDRR